MAKSKSSATSATRKKHAAKKAPDGPSTSSNPLSAPAKGKTKKERKDAKSAPRKKVYIPPSKPAPARPDPLDTLNLVSLIPPELAITLRALGKKSLVTRMRGVEDLKSSWLAQSELMRTVLPVWMHHLPSLLTHPSRRLRVLAGDVQRAFVGMPDVREDMGEFEDDEHILGAWCIAAHDGNIGARESWKAYTKPTERLAEYLVTAIEDPLGVYAAIHVAGEEDEGETEEDRKARLRVGALGGVAWCVGHVPVTLSEALWECLTSEGQPGVRKATWALVGVLLDKEEDIEDAPVLDAAWQEFDAGVQSIMWGPLLRYLKRWPGEEGHVDDFLSFLAHGLNTQGYGAVVVVLSTLQISEDETLRLFTSLWAPIHNRTLPGREHKALLECVFECFDLLNRRHTHAVPDQVETTFALLKSGQLKVDAGIVGRIVPPTEQVRNAVLDARPTDIPTLVKVLDLNLKEDVMRRAVSQSEDDLIVGMLSTFGRDAVTPELAERVVSSSYEVIKAYLRVVDTEEQQRVWDALHLDTKTLVDLAEEVPLSLGGAKLDKVSLDGEDADTVKRILRTPPGLLLSDEGYSTILSTITDLDLIDAIPTDRLTPRLVSLLFFAGQPRASAALPVEEVTDTLKAMLLEGEEVFELAEEAGIDPWSLLPRPPTGEHTMAFLTSVCIQRRREACEPDRMWAVRALLPEDGERARSIVNYILHEVNSPEARKRAVDSVFASSSGFGWLLGDVIQHGTSEEVSRLLGVVFAELEPGEVDGWVGVARKIGDRGDEVIKALCSAGAEGKAMDRWRAEWIGAILNGGGVRAMRKLAASIPRAESDIVFVQPVQRAVNLVRAMEEFVSEEDEDPVIATLLLPLLPILQNVPGAHWEFIYDVIASSVDLKMVLAMDELATTNRVLREEWSGRRKEVIRDVLDYVVEGGDDVDALRILAEEEVDWDVLPKLCHLFSAEAYPLLNRAARAWTEHWVVEVAIGSEEARIPQELLDVLDEDLFAWMILFDLFDGASLKLKSIYVEQVRDLAAVFMANVVDTTFPLDGWAVDEFYVSLYEPDALSEQILRAHLFHRALLTVPSLLVVDKAIAAYTAKWFSKGLIAAEVTAIRSDTALQDEQFKVRIVRDDTEVVAAYLVDEHSLELRMRLPADWPLARLAVTGPKRVGVDEERWRRWVLGVQHGSGRLVERLGVFKRNVEGHFEGQVECAICYSIISVMDGTLPTRPCRTCKNRFHGGCLYKWFSTSHSSSCPLCRSDMV